VEITGENLVEVSDGEVKRRDWYLLLDQKEKHE